VGSTAAVSTAVSAPEPDLTPEVLTARAKALIPDIVAQADEAEKIGHHTPELTRSSRGRVLPHAPAAAVRWLRR